MDIDPDGVVEEMAKLIARLALEFLNEHQEADGNVSYSHHGELSISADKCFELAEFAYRDVSRISSDQKDQYSRQKFAAYHGFWFAKLKPLSNVFRASAPDTEVVDINERFAINLVAYLLELGGLPLNEDETAAYAKETGFEHQPMPLVWQRCSQSCDRQCFRQCFASHMTFHEGQNFEYMVHSLRRRATGPYDLVNVLEALVYSACTGQD